MKRKDGAYMTSGEMEAEIHRKEEIIRRKDMEIDNLWDRIAKLEFRSQSTRSPRQNIMWNFPRTRKIKWSP